MHYGTAIGQLVGAAASASRRWTQQIETLFCVKWRHGPPWWKWDVANPTPSVNAYFIEEQSTKISPLSDLKRWSPRLFFDERPPNNKKMSRDMGSVPDPKFK